MCGRTVLTTCVAGALRAKVKLRTASFERTTYNPWRGRRCLSLGTIIAGLLAAPAFLHAQTHDRSSVELNIDDQRFNIPREYLAWTVKGREGRSDEAVVQVLLPDFETMTEQNKRCFTNALCEAALKIAVGSKRGHPSAEQRFINLSGVRTLSLLSIDDNIERHQVVRKFEKYPHTFMGDTDVFVYRLDGVIIATVDCTRYWCRSAETTGLIGAVYSFPRKWIANWLAIRTWLDHSMRSWQQGSGEK